MDQLLGDYATSDASTILYSLGITVSQLQANTYLLIVYALFLIISLLSHTGKLSLMLIIQRSAYLLTLIIILKMGFIMFDLLANACLLYELLYRQSNQMFQITNAVAMLLSVFSISPAITTCTNVVLNLPLHYKYLRMQLNCLRLASSQSLSQVTRARVLSASARKTFNPLLMATMGSCSVYAVFALTLVAIQVFDLDASVGTLGSILTGRGIDTNNPRSWLTNK